MSDKVQARLEVESGRDAHVLNADRSPYEGLASPFSSSWTFGCELEWADVDTRVKLPPELGVWDVKEKDVHNTDGTAYWFTHIGGEVLTTPVGTPHELEGQVRSLVELLKPTLTYRCFTHIHIRVPGLTEELPSLKKLLQYTVDSQPYVNSQIACIPQAGERGEYESREDWMAARKWQRQQEFWMTQTHPKSRIEEMLGSESFEEFYLSTYPPRKTGTDRCWWLGARPGVNLRSLHKHGTVEFRFFYGSIDPTQVRHVAEFCAEYMSQALGEGVPIEEWYPVMKKLSGWDFPSPLSFIPWQERRFEETRRGHGPKRKKYKR